MLRLCSIDRALSTPGMENRGQTGRSFPRRSENTKLLRGSAEGHNSSRPCPSKLNSPWRRHAINTLRPTLACLLEGVMAPVGSLHDTKGTVEQSGIRMQSPQDRADLLKEASKLLSSQAARLNSNTEIVLRPISRGQCDWHRGPPCGRPNPGL